ncbi:hypothetical protein dsx2_2481 [Desulfovibrio sp. X2]|uniref:hypothetical protein n=1 Tax=Desulfovibrio sp. X2 TaxID=941449 RepID=UPI000358D8F1|nr:hypothetical protein [Desulfovibrio sp. X2]EPR43121.1 hypothetical protein dsx2_2481 [Desulfovibrio sp. X2]
MSPEHTDPTYKDAVAVVSGLERLSDDLVELIAEIGTAERNLYQDLAEIQARGCAPAARIEELDNLRRQLSWLAGDVERMRAALTREGTHHGS